MGVEGRGREGEQDKFCAHVVKLTFHRYTVVHSDIQEVYRSSNSSSAEVFSGAVGHNCSVAFLPDTKQLSAMERSAFADTLCEATWCIRVTTSTGTCM